MPCNRATLFVLVLLLASCASPTRAPLVSDNSYAETPQATDRQRTAEPAPGEDGDTERPAVEAGEIIVTGRMEEGVPVVPLDSVGSRDIFGPKQIRETGARDINDLVQYIPAISTRPYNGGEASAPHAVFHGI